MGSDNDLKEKLKKHKAWLESDGLDGEKFIFTIYRYFEANFMKADLRKTSIKMIECDRYIFIETNLSNATFRDSAFYKGNFYKANLSKTEIYGCEFLQADLREADFTQADIMACIFKEAKLKGANFRQAKIQSSQTYRSIVTDEHDNDNTGTDGLDIEITPTDFSGIEFVNVNFDGAIFQDTNLSGATIQYSTLTKTIFNNANLKGTILINSDLTNANFEMSDFTGATFVNVILNNTKFDDNNFSNLKIDKYSYNQMPKEVKEKYEHTWFLLDGINNITNSITRSIEFPPEYHTAGISILNHFATILRQKYPDQKAKVRIDQDGYKVTMTIETIEGDREIIEKALDDYGLVVKGEMPIEEYTDDPKIIMGLKSELRIANVRIEDQKDLMQYQVSEIQKRDMHIEKRDLQIDKLLDLICNGVQHPIEVKVDVSPHINSYIRSSATSNVGINLTLTQNISPIKGNLNELIQALPADYENRDEIKKEIEEIKQALEDMKKYNSPDEVKESAEVSKVRRFLDKLKKGEGKIGKAIEVIKDGAEIVKSFAGHFDKISEWFDGSL